MGFSFRGKTSDNPVTVTEADGTSSATDVNSIPTDPTADLNKFRKLHTFDPFLDVDKLEAVDNVLVTGDLEKEAAVEEQLLAEDSPYPEVRSSVSLLGNVTCAAIVLPFVPQVLTGHPI